MLLQTSDAPTSMFSNRSMGEKRMRQGGAGVSTNCCELCFSYTVLLQTPGMR